MKVITKNGWFRPDSTMFPRLEPWTTPQDLEDDAFDIMPKSMIIVVPPAGYRFKEGIQYSNGDFQPGVPLTGQAVGAPARWPTKADVELIPDGEDEDADVEEAEVDAVDAEAVVEAEVEADADDADTTKAKIAAAKARLRRAVK